MSDLDFTMDTGVDLNATTEVHLTEPLTGEKMYDENGEPVVIKTISALGMTFNRKLHAIQQDYKSKAKNNVGKFKGILTFDQQESYEAEVYAAVMVGWHLARGNGGPVLDVPFNEKNAIAWCKANPLYRTQLSNGSDKLDNFATDHAGNFTTKDSPASTKRSKAKSA